MNKQEALKAGSVIEAECKKHDFCDECPFFMEEVNDCLIGTGGPNIERLEYFCGFAKNEADQVNSPSHYCRRGMECIDAIKALCEGLEGTEAYYAGNVLKYIWRFKFKNGVEDLKKARHYLEWLIEEEEKK